MHWTVTVAVLALMVTVMDTKPVAQKRGPPSGHDKPVEGGSEDDQQGTNLPYDKYLREVVMALEEDPEFRKRLEESNVSDIKLRLKKKMEAVGEINAHPRWAVRQIARLAARDGSVAKHIEMVSHQVRSKLDEIKRREIYRLQELRRLQMRSMQGVGNIDLPAHLDIANPHSFEMKDLESLIKQTTRDLEELDEQRKKEFKEYEMEKEYEKRDRLEHMNEQERIKEQEKIDEMKKKHGDHPKIHHPGSKDQFEEVWDKKDHLEDQEFNPKTFFRLHDIEGDGFWGIEEVEAVLQSELDKVYDNKNPEDDPMERFEEMNRMREHIFTEMDKDHDARISEEEFLNFTGKQGENTEFQKDEGWKTVDEEDMFTDDEYQRFIQEHHAQPGEINMPPQHVDPNVQHMGQLPPGGAPPGQPQNLQFEAHSQPPVQDFQQQQNQFAQQQQILQHQQQQFAQQQAVQQQLAQQHAQMQQQHLQQQQQQINQQQQMGQQLNQQAQAQVPVQTQQVHGQVPVQNQQQAQVPVQNQQAQAQVPVQNQQQAQVPVQAQQQAQQPVQNMQQGQGQQQGQVPVQQPAQGQQQQAQPTQ